MRSIKSWHRTFLMMSGVLAVLALILGSTVAVQAKIKCSCACKGNTRAYCAYHKCPCNPTSSARLQGVTLANEQGAVDLVLPPDIGAGDRISGTVFVEPREGEPTNALDGYVLETPDGTHTLSGSKQTITFAATAAIAAFVLLDPAGNEVASGHTLPSQDLAEALSYPEGPPRAVKAGEGFAVGGEFDGDAQTTQVSLGGADMEVIAESPRGIFIDPIGNAPEPGPNDLIVDENGQITQYSVNVVDLSMSADKLKLLVGEETQVHVNLAGVEGLRTGDCYVDLMMEAGSSARFAEAAGDTIEHRVDRRDISEDGTYSFSTSVIGTRPGTFGVVASLLAGNEKTFTFTNNETHAVNDLHIQWSRGVTVKTDQPFGTTSGSRTSRTDHADGNVAVGGSGSVTVDWNGTMPKVRIWWWTLDGKRVGSKKRGNP